jgi:hypothetical protein
VENATISTISLKKSKNSLFIWAGMFAHNTKHLLTSIDVSKEMVVTAVVMVLHDSTKVFLCTGFVT